MIFVLYLDFIVAFFLDFVNGISAESKNIAPYVALASKSEKKSKEKSGFKRICGKPC